MTELVLINGDFYTQDPVHSRATAVAIRDGRFLAVGDDEEIRDLARPGASVINLEGRRVLPGLTDAHFHFYDWALGLRRLPLADTTSLADLGERLAKRASETPPGRWIMGQGWNETRWPAPRLPTRADLDEAAPQHPVILWRSDLHLAVANSPALHKAGISGDTPDPPGGVIDRDEFSQPTGVLRELAINLVRAAIPPPTEDETVQAMRAAFPLLHRLGLTGVHDYRLMGGADGPPAFRAYQRLQAVGDLPLRLWMNLPGECLDEAIALGQRSGFGDDYLCVGHVKLFADGSQGARTAWMLEPYADTSGCGLPLAPMGEIAEAVRCADRAGLAVAIHAIGDRANREVLTVFEHTLLRLRPSTRSFQDTLRTGSGQARNTQAGRSDRTAIYHRIEHVQNIHPDDVARLGRLGVVASVQPIHVPDDIPLIEESVGERARFAYPFRDLWDAGAVLALGSDCPVADPNPLWGIHAAVTRQRRDGTPPGGWYPAQRLTVAEAVWGFAMGPALVSGRAAKLGSITPGKLADLVILDRDIFAVEPMEIADAQVVMTVLGGEVVYRR